MKENSEGDYEAQDRNFLNWTWQRNSLENRTKHVFLRKKGSHILIDVSKSNLETTTKIS